MSNQKTLLLALDFTRDSESLLEYAISFASHYHWNIAIINVIDHHVNQLMGEDFNNKKEQISSQLKSRQGQLKTIIERHHDVKFIVKAEVRIGYIHREISECAIDINADLIIMGKKPASNGFVFESTIDQIISITIKPILLIPSKLHFKPFSDILFCTEFLFDDFIAFNFMKSFAPSIHVLHVTQNADALMESTAKLDSFKSFSDDVVTVDKVIHSNVNRAIIKYAENHHIDVYVLIHKKRNLWESIFHSSTSKYIGKNSALPVLVFQQSKY